MEDVSFSLLLTTLTLSGTADERKTQEIARRPFFRTRKKASNPRRSPLYLQNSTRWMEQLIHPSADYRSWRRRCRSRPGCEPCSPSSLGSTGSSASSTRWRRSAQRCRSRSCSRSWPTRWAARSTDAPHMPSRRGRAAAAARRPWCTLAAACGWRRVHCRAWRSRLRPARRRSGRTRTRTARSSRTPR